MANRNGQSQSRHFALDIESLLMSDESQDEQKYSQTSSSESFKNPKKLKSKDSKPLLVNKIKTANGSVKTNGTDQNEEDEEIGEFNDVSKFFENVGNDFGKSMQVRKIRLSQFTEALISVYESKLSEMVKRQELEVKEFKERALCNIQEELNKGEEEFKKLKLQENKVVKALEQQVKLFQKTAANLKCLIENFNKVHKNFIQGFEDLKVKHRNEALELKKILCTDTTTLQNKFLTESKKEEMQTVKKYLFLN